MTPYRPPLGITPAILGLVERIGETLGHWSATTGADLSPRLRRDNRIKSVQASLAIETLIHDRRHGYYGALSASNRAAESAPFVTFMLETLLAAMDEAVLAQDTGDQVSDPAGDPVNDPVAERAGDPVSDQADARIRRLLGAFRGDEALTIGEIMARLGLAHRPTLRKNYLRPALDGGWISMTQPNAPSSPTQRYRPTPKARPS